MTTGAGAGYDEETDCDLGWSIGMLMRSYQLQVQPRLTDLPRGPRAYQLLYTVINKNLPNQLQMAEYLGIDPTVLPYVIDDLVETGLVERVPDPKDRRARKVVATSAGRARFGELQAAVDTAEGGVLAALSPDEQALFRSLLSRLARRARDDSRDDGRAIRDGEF